MTQHAISPPSTPPAVRTIAIVVLSWTAISTLGALQTYSDNLRLGVDSHYPSLLVTWFVEYAVPLIVLSAGLILALARWPGLIARPRNVFLLFVGLVLVFQPAQWTYMAWLRGYLHIASVDDARRLLMKMLLVGWFSTTGTFAAILAVHYWRQARERELAWQRSQTDMLNLRLALEEQRMLALRAQFEPHFLFNALNAISALVREGDRTLALGGIGRLSDLLRYALSASVRNTATVADELQFVRDYLDLQRLRYGDRLQVRIEGDDALLHDVDCPPLLLQPLIENALRHDLDCHDRPSDIRLSFVSGGAALTIRVTNPALAQASPNPGAGLGLANTRERLRLMHPTATLRTTLQDGRFVAEVRLPLARE
ncbi:histidine kinase [Massilia sp. Root133]|uniref:sensor histidine kinase n=1 Tax=unclassified Massilia TaxID=2609279 RepID=UPI0006F4B7DE|nr:MULTISPECIES: histidine kinase [unclassified Massilia]KQY02857.1 histidine kinase [Massilia sp. Root133]KQZ50283.1 histidine kinase [Massilia sp. Root1485]